jgi:hypothetical protein
LKPVTPRQYWMADWTCLSKPALRKDFDCFVGSLKPDV